MNPNRIPPPPRCGAGWFLLAALLGFGVGRADADDAIWQLPALSASPKDVLKAAALEPAPKDGDIEMLFEEHVFTLDEHGRQHRASRRVYRCLTEKGVDDWSCTEADWLPWCEEKPVFRVRVITPDGQAHALDPESVFEAPAEQESPNLFSDQKLLRAPLPAVAVGAVVEEQIEIREVHSLFEHGVVERFLLAQSYPVRKLRLVIDAPSALPLRHLVTCGDAKPARSEAGGRTRLVFELGPLPATEGPEPYLPAEEAKLPQVVFSTGKSWNDVAAAYAALVESRLDLEAVRPLVQKTIEGETDRGKIIEKLLAVLRGQIRYTGVEFGRGAIEPRTSRETLARRYGDCKDQATLLVAMLSVAGIQARVALLRTGRNGDVAPSLPGLGDFDHAIVCIPGDRPLWIDPSARCAPVGCLPLVDQGRWAMLAGPDTQELVRTSRTDYRINTSRQVFELQPAENGRGHIRVTVACGGSCEEDLREDYASLGIRSLRKRWKDYLKEPFRPQSMPRLEYSSPLDLGKPFSVTAEVPDARIGQFDETSATIRLMPDGLFHRLPDLFLGVESEEDGSGGLAGSSPLDERRGPLLLPEPHLRQLQYRIALPAGFAAKTLPESFVKRCGPAEFSQKFELSGDNVIVGTFHFDTGPGRFTAEEVEDLRQAIAELAKDENSPWEVKIELENAAAKHLAAGRPGAALTLAREEMARHAERADHRAHYSRLLLQVGLGEAARAEARRAVELAPRSSAAWSNLARVLTHDLLGRRFRPGMDWTAAAAAYGKALEIDPSDVAARMDWAILLEHDEDGLRYAPGTRLNEAVEEYRRAQRQLGPHDRLDDLEINLALSLLFSERYADLEKLASRGGKSTTWRGFLLAAIAARQGALDAYREALELIPDARLRREAAQTAAEYLQQARLYAPASALYEAAAEGSAKADELRAKAKAAAGLRRMGEADYSPEPTRRAVQELLAAALSGSRSRAKLPGLLAAGTSPADRAAAMQALHRTVRPALEMMREHQIPPLRVVDTMLQAEIAVEADAAGGALVRVRGELVDVDWRVVAVQGQVRLAAPAARTAGAAEGDSTPTDALRTRLAALVESGNSDQLRQALDEALSAVKRTKRENAACLHTLAAVHAELGNTLEALNCLRRVAALRGERIDDSDWYVLGRIAEQYGLADVAAGLYRRVPLKEPPAADDVGAIARRRLKGLEK